MPSTGTGSAMDSPAPRRPGRPRDEAKRNAILDAAKRLMLVDGYKGVAIDAVIAASGVSRSAFYGNFADRDALVEALVAREVTRLRVPDIETDISFNEAPTKFGFAATAILLKADTIGFEPVVASVTGRAPELTTAYFDATVGNLQETLADLLSRDDAPDFRVGTQIEQAADDLLAVWHGLVHHVVALGLATAESSDATEQRILRGIALVLGITIEASGSGG